MSHENDPIEPTIDGNGRLIYPGDPVTIARIYKPLEEQIRYGNLDSLQAIFLGEDVAYEDGEPLFGGELTPHFSLTLSDGSVEEVWGYECDWMHPEVYSEALEYLAAVNEASNN